MKQKTAAVKKTSDVSVCAVRMNASCVCYCGGGCSGMCVCLCLTGCTYTHALSIS